MFQLNQPETVVTLKPSIPANYLQMTQILPSFSALEISALKRKIKSAEDRVTSNLEMLEQSRDKEIKIVSKFLCCLAYFDLGQLQAKMAQAFFSINNFTEGKMWAERTKNSYDEVKVYKWPDLIRKYYYQKKLFRRHKTAPSRIESQGMYCSYLFETALLYFMQYKAIIELELTISSNEKKQLLNDFLEACTKVEEIDEKHVDLLFLKSVFLLCFFNTGDKFIEKKYTNTARKFLHHSKYDKKRKLISFVTSAIDKIKKGEDDEIYKTVVPENNSDPGVRDFFATVFLEAAYGRFNNPDLTIFNQGMYPADTIVNQAIEFGLVLMPVSIGDIYKFLAHFRNITLRFQFAADPKLNTKIIEALYEAKLLDISGNILGGFEESDAELIKLILLPIYKQHFPNGTEETFSTDFLLKTKTEEFIAEQTENLHNLYNGFPPEKTLLLLGKSLQVVQASVDGQYSIHVRAAMNLIHDALVYRDQLRILDDADSSALARQFVIDLCSIEQQHKMLLVSCPVLGNNSDVERHAIFIVFYHTGDQVKIQIINTGFGAEHFHFEDEVAYAREIIVNVVDDNQREILATYITLLFNLSNQQVNNENQFNECLDHIYQLSGNLFEYNKNLAFSTQVTGNCTVFGAQWALNIALNLPEDERNKLTLDFAKGCDILATHIRTNTLISDRRDVPLITYALYDHTITFPCNYTSIARKKFPKPGNATVAEYVPGVPGTEHHVIPQSYLQFIYDELITTDPNLLCDVLNKPHGTAVTKKQFAYGHFGIFHGPGARTDDPADPKLDPYGGIERPDPPIDFPASRWTSLQVIGTTVKALLTSNPAQFTIDKAAALITCKAELAKIATDASRTICFKETSAGQTWEKDPIYANKYRLKV